jgi:hypothetical protein
LKFIDPEGTDLFLTGNDADHIVSELERITGLKLIKDGKTGRVTIDRSVTRKDKGTSREMAQKVGQIVGDSKAWVKIDVGRNQPGVIFDSFAGRKLDAADYDAYKKVDPNLAAAALGHVLEEYYYAEKMPSPMLDHGKFGEAHSAGNQFESEVMSDFTGWWEQPRRQVNLQSPAGHFNVRVVYTTVSYDILVKSGVGGDATIERVTKSQRKKPTK